MSAWIFGLIEAASNEQYISIVNERIIRAICERLGIGVPIRRCTDIIPREELRDLEATERLVALARAAGATRYISGPAAKAYLDLDPFRAAGIEVAWMDYGGYPPYPQLWGEFAPRVSILDLLLNTGPEAPRYLAKGPN